MKNTHSWEHNWVWSLEMWSGKALPLLYSCAIKASRELHPPVTRSRRRGRVDGGRDEDGGKGLILTRKRSAARCARARGGSSHTRSQTRRTVSFHALLVGNTPLGFFARFKP